MSETPCPFCGQIHGTACNQSDATTPAVVQDAQQYDWREDWNRVQTRIGYDEDAHVDAMHRLAAYIERLEPADDEVDGFYCLAEGHTHRNRYAEALCSARYQIRSLETERDALRKWKHDRTNTEHVTASSPLPSVTRYWQSMRRGRRIAHTKGVSESGTTRGQPTTTPRG